MTHSRKYSALPDLDTAPDIYETPELTDDNSTVLTTARGSLSDDDSDVENNDNAGISRSHVQVDEARTHFMGKDVDARNVDFSDRVDGKRKSYRTSTNRRRLKNGGLELGDLSDEDDDEKDEHNSLERKIARLKREVEEAKEAYVRQRAEAEAASNTAAAAPPPADLDSLSQALDDISRLVDADAARRLQPVPPQPVTAEAPSQPTAGQQQPVALGAPTSPRSPTAARPASPPLAQVADFDRRLALLERSVGIGSSVLLPGTDSGNIVGTGSALPRAILPTLDSLQRQIATLTDASVPSLDGISRRVRTLTQEADQLTKARKAAKAAHEELVSIGVGQAITGLGPVPGQAKRIEPPADPDQSAKINALYGTLPTIESLTPLLPPLLDRLRSLQAIHADAATASELLDSLEQRQAETAAEVRQWREGLDKIETSMKAGESTMDRNVQVMEGWVKELEARLERT